jgi:hypothetical protein
MIVSIIDGVIGGDGGGVVAAAAASAVVFGDTILSRKCI